MKLAFPLVFSAAILFILASLNLQGLAGPGGKFTTPPAPATTTTFTIEETNYIQGPGGIAFSSSGSETRFYHQDRLGSTKVMSKSDGSAAYSTDFGVFGQPFNEQGQAVYKYTGKEEDQTGLFYYGARYYQPEVGRFTQVDTVGGLAYAYANDNPLKFIDPSGMQAEYLGPPAPNEGWTEYQERMQQPEFSTVPPDASRAVERTGKPIDVIFIVTKDRLEESGMTTEELLKADLSSRTQEGKWIPFGETGFAGMPVILSEGYTSVIYVPQDIQELATALSWTSALNHRFLLVESHAGPEAFYMRNGNEWSSLSKEYLPSLYPPHPTEAAFLFGCQMACGGESSIAQSFASWSGSPTYADPSETNLPVYEQGSIWNRGYHRIYNPVRFEPQK